MLWTCPHNYSLDYDRERLIRKLFDSFVKTFLLQHDHTLAEWRAAMPVNTKGNLFDNHNNGSLKYGEFHYRRLQIIIITPVDKRGEIWSSLP